MKGWLIRLLVTAVGITLRYRVEDPHGVFTRPANSPLIFVFWHNRIFLMPYFFRKFWLPYGRNHVAVLVSRSKDGQLLSDALAAFGLHCVRGSSSRGGSTALLALARLAAENYDVAITPDGPRGPRYVLQPGCVHLAALTGIAIVPFSYSLSRKITIKSWDAFAIPLPFAHCTLRLGTPVSVPRDASDDIRRQKQQEVERALQHLTD